MIQERFRAVRKRGEFLVGAAVGSGLFATAAEQGGADFVLALNAGRFRLMGAASAACMLPIADANAFVAQFATGEFSHRCSVPVIFGASGMGTAESPEDIAASIAAMGFSGVINFPTVINYSEVVNTALEANEAGFGRELAILSAAQHREMFSIANVKTREQARQAAAIGIDMICLTFGWTVTRTQMKESVTLQEATLLAQSVAKVVRRENRDCFLVLEGGPLGSSEDLMPIYRAAAIDGYIGGSPIDRFPIERAVLNQTVRFKRTAVATRRHTEKERALIAFGRAQGFLGSSQRSVKFYHALRDLSRSSSKLPLVITGERGSGRQSAAEALFRLWGLEAKHWLALGAKELSAQRLLTVLFGHTNTLMGKSVLRGVLARPDVAGLVIRDLEQMTLHTQRRIARVLLRGKAHSTKGKPLQSSGLPMIFLASKSLKSLQEERLVSPELAELLPGRELAVPSVREHTEDIEELLLHALASISGRSKLNYRFSPAAMHRLQAHPWPGNYPELHQFAARLLATNSEEEVDEITLASLFESGVHPAAHPPSERSLILDALWRHGFHRGNTARFLGIARKTLYNKIRFYKLTG